MNFVLLCTAIICFIKLSPNPDVQTENIFNETIIHDGNADFLYENTQRIKIYQSLQKVINMISCKTFEIQMYALTFKEWLDIGNFLKSLNKSISCPNFFPNFIKVGKRFLVSINIYNTIHKVNLYMSIKNIFIVKQHKIFPALNLKM
ncbi:hypothetical protein EDEG_02572 [Edhazardia aedis USNM 41457]|uniref:Uncharacterized protein n=1 Tax=Edhazardia aedis (strain USNM 41457) TaxID=1003232 RepID=J9DKA4_EDHAE|nr:hypothetical protein EDEG_02572 [Edhazardia aedis USNM 41457]|eukprot:EJW03040.1 hypothetical protein EDEG_02572 [Edhazardia aedis USNM 41457]